MCAEDMKKIIRWAGTPEITDSDKIQKEKKLVMDLLRKIPYRHFLVIWQKIIQGKDWYSMEEKCYYSQRQMRTYQREGFELLKTHVERAVSAGQIDREDLEKILY